jgi:threonine/homoserine/homoserine lactone efflux protein
LLFLRTVATSGITEAREATALDGAFLLIFNPKAYLIVVLMFSQFLPASGMSDAGLVLWITTVLTVNNLEAFTISRWQATFGCGGFAVRLLRDQ